MEVFEKEKRITFCDNNEPILKKSLTKRRKFKKKASQSESFIKLSQSILLDKDSSKHQMWRKFRTTSWVVRICTDFAPLYNDLHLG